MDIRAFAKSLAARGYDVWLRRGDGSKGTDQGSPRSSMDDSPRSPTASHVVVIVALKGVLRVRPVTYALMQLHVHYN